MKEPPPNQQGRRTVTVEAPTGERRPGFLLEGWVEGEGWAPVRIGGDDAIFATPDEARAAANAIDDALPAWSDERTIYRAVDLATGFARWEERHATGEGGWG